MREKSGRLVNLDVAPGFTSVTPRLDPLLEPDRNNLAPRVAFSWRPMAAQSMVVRGGYGIYHNTSVYQPLAMQMAQQAPLSHNLRRIGNSPCSGICQEVCRRWSPTAGRRGRARHNSSFRIRFQRVR